MACPGVVRVAAAEAPRHQEWLLSRLMSHAVVKHILDGVFVLHAVCGRKMIQGTIRVVALGFEP